MWSNLTVTFSACVGRKSLRGNTKVCVVYSDGSTVSVQQNKTDTCANSVDLDETAPNAILLLIYTCQPLAAMNVSKCRWKSLFQKLRIETYLKHEKMYRMYAHAYPAESLREFIHAHREATLSKEFCLCLNKYQR